MLYSLLFILLSQFPQPVAEENLLDWDESRKITWNDFKGSPPAGATTAALTNSGINVQFGFNNSVLTYTIRCRFNKSLSWGRIKNDYILSHEQRHFDIAELHARILFRELKAYTFNSKTVGADVNAIYEKVMKRHVSMQQAYDQETNHSLKSAEQLLWDKKIASLLTDYSAFSEYR